MYPSNTPTDDEENLQKLPEDHTSPASPAAPGNTHEDIHTPLPPDYPQKDTDMDATEANDVGVDVASGVTPPSESNVVAFQPPDSEPEDDTENAL